MLPEPAPARRGHERVDERRRHHRPVRRYRAQLASAQRLEKRLLELATAKNGTLDQVLTVERELARVRGEIESYQGHLKQWNDQVSLSTLTITMSTRSAPVAIAVVAAGDARLEDVAIVLQLDRRAARPRVVAADQRRSAVAMAAVPRARRARHPALGAAACVGSGRDRQSDASATNVRDPRVDLAGCVRCGA